MIAGAKEEEGKGYDSLPILETFFCWCWVTSLDDRFAGCNARLACVLGPDALAIFVALFVSPAGALACELVMLVVPPLLCCCGNVVDGVLLLLWLCMPLVSFVAFSFKNEFESTTCAIDGLESVSEIACDSSGTRALRTRDKIEPKPKIDSWLSSASSRNPNDVNLSLSPSWPPASAVDIVYASLWIKPCSASTLYSHPDSCVIDLKWVAMIAELLLFIHGGVLFSPSRALQLRTPFVMHGRPFFLCGEQRRINAANSEAYDDHANAVAR